MARGGKREGSGRKTGTGKYGEKTKIIRIPISRESEIKRILQKRITPLEWQQGRRREIEYFEPLMASQKQVDLYTASVQAGYPTPVDESKEGQLDLNAHLIGSPKDTFFVRVSGESMIDAGINDGDLLIVDRTLPVVNGKIVIAVVNGDLTVKRIFLERDKVILYPENPLFSAIEVSNDNEFMTLGVVTNVIHQL